MDISLAPARTPAIRRTIKSLAIGAAQVFAFPLAALSGFGRSVDTFVFWGHVLAPIPGRYFGRLLRIAYYTLTLDSVGSDFNIEIGSRFTSPRVRIGNCVGISPGCCICACDIGDGVGIASGVRIMDGYRQHARNARGELTDEPPGERIFIGRHAFIGADSLVMSNVGAYATVGAGSVVYEVVEPGTTVVGNPAQWRWSSRHLVQLAVDLESGARSGARPPACESARLEGIKAEVRRYIRHRYEIPECDEEFTDDVHLFNYGYIDSFGAVDLLQFLEDAFGIPVRQRDVRATPMNTINEISEFVAARLEGTANEEAVC